MSEKNIPLVSVYIVNHNYGEYLETAIESVLSQTLKNFEIIFIDNGSSDDSKERVKKYFENKKIKFIFQKNLGLNAANNVALKFSKGKYLIRLDADDYFDKNALEILSSKLERDKNIGLVFPDYYTVDKEGEIIDMIRRHDFSEVTLLDQPAHGACSMLRREILLALDGYDESYHCQDGWDLWIRFIKKFGVGNINLPLFFYRDHGKNLTKDKSKILSTRAKIFKKNSKKKIDHKSIAVIPIRGSLVDDSSVALKKLGKKLVIDWTIDSALKSSHISEVFVTTPDKKIIQHLRKKYSKKVKIITREVNLARFGVNIDVTLTDLFENIKNEINDFSILCLLYIEYPFRGSKYIDMAIDAMEVFNTKRVISMQSMDKKFYTHSGKGMVPVHKSFYLKQENQQFFSEAGGIYVIKRGSMFRDTPKDYKIGHIDVDDLAALNISTKYNWELGSIFAKKNEEF